MNGRLERRRRSDVPMMIAHLNTHPRQWLTTAELAAYWGIHRKQLYKHLDAGTLRAIRFGPRLVRISVEEAVRFEREAKMRQP